MLKSALRTISIILVSACITGQGHQRSGIVVASKIQNVTQEKGVVEDVVVNSTTIDKGLIVEDSEMSTSETSTTTLTSVSQPNMTKVLLKLTPTLQTLQDKVKRLKTQVETVAAQVPQIDGDGYLRHQFLKIYRSISYMDNEMNHDTILTQNATIFTMIGFSIACMTCLGVSCLSLDKCIEHIQNRHGRSTRPA